MTKAEVNVSRETFPLLFSSSDTRCFPVSLFHNRLFSACRFSSLSDHAARQSGNLKRFRGGENGEGSAELWAAARHKAPRAKNLVSTGFFTLSYMSKRSCAETPEAKSRRRFRRWNPAEVCGASTQTSGVEKSCIDKIFHSSDNAAR